MVLFIGTYFVLGTALGAFATDEIYEAYKDWKTIKKMKKYLAHKDHQN